MLHAGAGGATSWLPPPAGLAHLADAYTDFTRVDGTIAVRVRLFNLLIRTLRLPSWVFPAKTVHEHFGFVARRGDDLFLVFRGTRTAVDWWEDLHLEQAPIPAEMLPAGGDVRWQGAAAEGGVLALYQTMRDAILSAIRRHAPPARLFVTGHSLGACLAKLAVPDLMANTPFTGEHQPVLYTFGQPRFVNRAFARAFAGTACQAFRIVHTEDIVPSLMPAVPVLWFAGRRHHLFYAHAGVPVDFTLTEGEEVPDGQALLARNHAMSTYQQALWPPAGSIAAGGAPRPV